jgi:hypothetical protein
MGHPSNHGIDFDSLGLRGTRLDHERKKPEETFGTRLHTFQVHPIKIEIQLRRLRGNVDQSVHALDEEILAVGKET